MNGIDSDDGARAIAEGVETANQLASLRAVGCDSAQGFFLSRPLPAADVVGLLRGGSRW